MDRYKTRYTVELIQSGQPRAYADTIREAIITVESNHPNGRFTDGEFRPSVVDIEKIIANEERARKENRIIGGATPDQHRAGQHEWAKRIVRGIFQERFREPDDDDGMTGTYVHFYPTLKTLKVDPAKGTIHVVIVEPFTD